MNTALNKVADPEVRAQLYENVTGLMRLAYEQQGIKALESTRRIAAVHEAGHAVVFEATADGVRWWRAYRLRIWRNDEIPGVNFWGGETTVSPKAPLERVDTRIDPAGTAITAMRAIAGWTAEQLFTDDFRIGSSLDEVTIASGCAKGLSRHWMKSPEECFAMLFSMTREILKANAVCALRIADRLEFSRRIDSPDLRRLLADVKIGFKP